MRKIAHSMGETIYRPFEFTVTLLKCILNDKNAGNKKVFGACFCLQ